MAPRFASIKHLSRARPRMESRNAITCPASVLVIDRVSRLSQQSDLIVSPAGGCDSDAHGVWLRGTDKLSYMCSDLAAAVELGPDGLGGIGG